MVHQISSGADDVLGRVNLAPDDAGRVTDGELVAALNDAIGNPPPDVARAVPFKTNDGVRA